MNASKPNVLIIGGGVAGLAAARALETYGITVDLVEKGDRLGGNAFRWACMATEGCRYCGACLSVELADAVQRSSHARVRLNTTAARIERQDGGFSIILAGTADDTTNDTIKADAVLLAAGMTPYDPKVNADLGYGVFDQVITTADLNTILKQDRLAEILPATSSPSIGFIQCVGSRDRQSGRDYCSQVCCKTAVRQANKIIHQIPEADISVFHIDLQIIGKAFRDQTARMRSRVRLQQGVPGKIFNDRQPGKVSIIEEDHATGARTIHHFDLIVLAVGMLPSEQTGALAGQLDLKTDDWGFFSDTDGCLASGIYTAGAAQGPTDIVSAKEQGVVAAHRMAMDLGWAEARADAPSVVILGGSPEAERVAGHLAGRGYAPVILDNGAAGVPVNGVPYHADVRLTAIRGTAGGFTVSFRSAGDSHSIPAAAIVAAAGTSHQPDRQTAGRVMTLSRFATACDQNQVEDARTVVFWLDRHGPEWKAYSRRCLGLAEQWATAGKRAVILMERMLVHGAQGQRQYDRARHLGVRFMRVADAARVTVNSDEDCINLAIEEATLPGVTVDLATDLLVIPEDIGPPEWAAELSRFLHQERDPEGYLQSGNVRHRPVASPRQGIFFIGTCHDETDDTDIQREIEAVDAAIGKPAQGRSPLDPTALIDTSKCGRCLTCYRACPHGAVVIPDKIQPLILADECVGCGICVSSCPAKAIAFESASAPATVADTEGQTVVFACVRSGAPALRAAGFDDPAVKVIEVPCAGQIDEQMLLQPLLEGAVAVVIAACHDGNCRSMTGSRTAAVRVAHTADQIGVAPTVLRHHTVAANEPGRMAHLLASDGAQKEENA